MPTRTYTFEEKLNAIAAFHTHNGNIEAVNLQTGIPHRTLYQWRRNWYAKDQQQTFLPMEISELPATMSPVEQLMVIRARVFYLIGKVGDAIKPECSPKRALELIRAQGMLLKSYNQLDAILKPYDEEAQWQR